MYYMTIYNKQIKTKKIAYTIVKLGGLKTSGFR